MSERPDVPTPSNPPTPDPQRRESDPPPGDNVPQPNSAVPQQIEPEEQAGSVPPPGRSVPQQIEPERRQAGSALEQVGSGPQQVGREAQQGIVDGRQSSSGVHGLKGAGVAYVPSWQRVTCPPWALSATLLIGFAGAVLIPLDGPGVGWFLTAAVAVGLVYAVDRNARKTVPPSAAPTGEVQPPAATAMKSGSAGEPQASATVRVRTGLGSTGGERESSVVVAADEPAPTGEARVSAVVQGTVSNPGGVGSTPQPPATLSVASAADGQARASAPVSSEGARVPHKVARIYWVVMVLALTAVGAFRASEWLFVCCLAGAAAAASLAVVGRRSVNGTWADVFAVPLAALPGARWLYAGVERRRSDSMRRQAWGITLSVVATVALLAVFVPLLGGADATFAALFDAALPRFDGALGFQWLALFVVAGLVAAGALFVLAAPPMPASEGAGGLRVRQLRRIEWVLPVGTLTALFTVFVGAQFMALFGGDDYVQRTAGLTYAEYARTGFWQLSTVSVLTLAVLLLVLRWARQDTAGDRMWLRALFSAVVVLSLIIVASALGRMWTYQQAYGFTVLRVLVEVCELWLGLVYLLVLVSVLSLRRLWLGRAVFGTALAALLALAVVNPERLVADRNIDRWERGKTFDFDYLTELSADSLPAIDRLPEPMRTRAREIILARMNSDSWNSWNRSRSNAAR